MQGLTLKLCGPDGKHEVDLTPFLVGRPVLFLVRVPDDVSISAQTLRQICDVLRDGRDEYSVEYREMLADQCDYATGDKERKP